MDRQFKTIYGRRVFLAARPGALTRICPLEWARRPVFQTNTNHNMKTKQKPPKKKTYSYCSVFYRVNGRECSTSMPKASAAEVAVRLILGKADVVVIAKCKTKE